MSVLYFGGLDLHLDNGVILGKLLNHFEPTLPLLKVDTVIRISSLYPVEARIKRDQELVRSLVATDRLTNVRHGGGFSRLERQVV